MKPLSLAAAFSATLTAFPLAAIAGPGSFLNDGVAIQYTDEGTGPAVVLLHAFAGSSDLWQSAGLAPLAGFRTITYDARGHGASGKPTEADAYGELMVDDLAALFEDRGLEAAHIVGYSMGAETALSFATAHPTRVLSLTIAGSGWSGEAEAASYGYIAQALSGVASFGDFMVAMTPEGAEEPDLEQQAATGGLLAAHGIDPAQPAAPLAAVAAGLPAIIDLDAEALARLDFPVLGLAGTADEERANIEMLAAVLPDFRYVPIAEADHLSAPLAPVFARTVIGFLSE